MKNRNTHAMLLALVGGYMLYTAWHLFDNMRSGAQEMAPALYIAVIALFALAGVGVFVYAFIVWRSGRGDGGGGPQDRGGDGDGKE